MKAEQSSESGRHGQTSREPYERRECNQSCHIEGKKAESRKESCVNQTFSLQRWVVGVKDGSNTDRLRSTVPEVEEEEKRKKVCLPKQLLNWLE